MGSDSRVTPPGVAQFLCGREIRCGLSPKAHHISLFLQVKTPWALCLHLSVDMLWSKHSVAKMGNPRFYLNSTGPQIAISNVNPSKGLKKYGKRDLSSSLWS